MAKASGILGITLGLLAVQAFDIAIHVGTGQVEPIRILSNAVLGLWAVWCWVGRPPTRAGLVAVALYLGLNAVFLARNGLTNPHQADAPRVTLFVLVAISTALALWLKTRAARA